MRSHHSICRCFPILLWWMEVFSPSSLFTGAAWPPPPFLWFCFPPSFCLMLLRSPLFLWVSYPSSSLLWGEEAFSQLLPLSSDGVKWTECHWIRLCDTCEISKGKVVQEYFGIFWESVKNLQRIMQESCKENLRLLRIELKFWGYFDCIHQWIAHNCGLDHVSDKSVRHKREHWDICSHECQLHRWRSECCCINNTQQRFIVVVSFKNFRCHKRSGYHTRSTRFPHLVHTSWNWFQSHWTFSVNNTKIYLSVQDSLSCIITRLSS